MDQEYAQTNIVFAKLSWNHIDDKCKTWRIFRTEV
jgi:hypothetical protein